jgi:hypothetical protein
MAAIEYSKTPYTAASVTTSPTINVVLERDFERDDMQKYISLLDVPQQSGDEEIREVETEIVVNKPKEPIAKQVFFGSLTVIGLFILFRALVLDK